MLYSPAPLHIPDGFLSVPVSLILWTVSIAVIGYSIRRVNKDLDERKIPLMGVLAAAIFAGQMLNFTIIGGTSGHLMGAAIATILLGPWAAVIVMTSVVAIQALIFQDGGILVLGANLFNMAIVGVAVSYFIYTSIRQIAGEKKWAIFAGGFAAAWFSIVAAALATGLELALSGTSPAKVAIPAMGGIHAIIGIGEGLITVGTLSLVYATRPDLLQNTEDRKKNSTILWIIGLLIAFILVIAAPLASTNPDGLEWVAEREGFLNLSNEPVYEIIPDYLLPGMNNEAAATITAGIIGVVLVLGVIVVTTLMRRKKSLHAVRNKVDENQDT